MSLRKLLPIITGIIVFAVVLWTVPAAWFRRGAERWIQGDLETQLQLARTVARQMQEGLNTSDYQTKSDLFDGEWLFGTHLMAGIGLCQMVAQHPEIAPEWNPVIDQCIRHLLSPPVRAFDRKSWDNEDPLESLDGDHGHAAYLGYMNFLLSLYREINPTNEFAAINDKLTATLVRRLRNSPTGLIETYPGEIYPVDNSPGIASIAIQGRVTGSDYSALLQREEQIYRTHYIDPHTGLLIQAVNGKGRQIDAGRGSGTALSIFFLRRAFPDLSREMFAAMQKNLESGLFGFGAIREYSHGIWGTGDVDSGPVIFGFSFSASGFGLSAARAFGDDRLFAKLYSSAAFAGVPRREDNRLEFLTAGPLGNSILLSMFTTPRVP